MKNLKDTKVGHPTLNQVEKELKGTFGGIAVLLNECFYPNSGSRMLGIPDDESPWGCLDKVDLQRTNIGRYLPIYYAYAYEGRLINGYESEIADCGSNIEKLTDFAYMFRSDASYFDLCLDVAGLDVQTDVGHLANMLNHLSARNDLDRGYDLSIAQIALLADMSERSVKNAISLDGTNRLHLNESGNVDNVEAIRWLKGRRGFRPTVKQNFGDEKSKCPDQIDAMEVPSFVRSRIEKLFGGNFLDQVAIDCVASPDYDGAYTDFPDIIKRAAKSSGLPPKVIQDAMQQPLRIAPEHCTGLAKTISVNPVWFTLQVMRALYPTQVDMLLNPEHYENSTQELNVEGNSVDIILNAAMIKHGYLDLPVYAKSLFPSDCFGSREKGDEGSLVELNYGGQKVLTDIRIKSEQTISPRKRFTAWLQKDLAAASGDRIRFKRINERVFELIHLPR